MYKILIDTSSKHFILMLLKDSRPIYTDVRKNWIKNADLLPIAFEKLLIQTKIEIKNISAYLVTLGPGSFTGARVGITFAKTLVQLSDAKLFAATSLEFLAHQNFSGKINLDARSNLVYSQSFKKGKTIGKPELISAEGEIITIYPLNLIKKNIKLFLNSFKQVNNIYNCNPFYLKEITLIKKVY